MPENEKKLVYEMFTYDLWGNEEDGYAVNDLYPQGQVEIVVQGKKINVGTKREFTDFTPTDEQLNIAVELLPKIIANKDVAWDGDDKVLYCTIDGVPCCELRLVED